ncbi:hypothetical protein [Paraburkholderia terrae]|uniref:hypothetical protein n=1 Tax=Paraburkholderia terrae TaxID=311230 RepID=UPI0020BE6788|nr:hypothetical protein [Paraburkholderia terrae]
MFAVAHGTPIRARNAGAERLIFIHGRRRLHRKSNLMFRETDIRSPSHTARMPQRIRMTAAFASHRGKPIDDAGMGQSARSRQPSLARNTP